MPRTLGLDFGTRRVGAAISDPRRQIASPLEVYERISARKDASHYKNLMIEEEIDRIVVGLPLHTGGGEGDLAILAREWGRWLAAETGLPVHFFDERYTSIEAEEQMRAVGVRARDRKALRDKLAAQILLQNYLDQGSPTLEAPSLPLDDTFSIRSDHDS